MEDLNPPESRYEKYPPPPAARAPNLTLSDTASVVKCFEDLLSPETKDRALFKLYMNRESLKDMASLLWYSFGTIFVLSQEVVSVYHLLSSPDLTERATPVYYAITLFECVASNPETRAHFLKAKLPVYLYPFMNTKDKGKPHEYLRQASLKVISTLVKSDDPEALLFLIQTEIYPYCLTCRKVGTDLSKQLSTFIIDKISGHEEVRD